MASSGKCDFKELKKFQKQLQKFQDDELEKFLEACAKNLTARLLRNVKERTPSKTGVLRDSWEHGQIIKNGDVYTIEITNPTEYASYVEYGHRQEVGRFVPAIGKKLKKGWAQGKFMLSISERELEADAPKILEAKLKRKLGDVFK